MTFKLPQSLTLELIEHATNLCNILLENIKTDKKALVIKTLMDTFGISEEEANKRVYDLEEKKDVDSGLEVVEVELEKILSLLNINKTKVSRIYELEEDGKKKKDSNGKYILLSSEEVDLDNNEIKMRLSAIKSKLLKSSNKNEEVKTDTN